MEDFIERTLLCAVKQTYSNLAILVIDDGSIDRTREIAERIVDDRPGSRVVSTANRGVAAARNLGIELAASLYVAFLDADDLWAPTKIERQVAALACHGHTREWAACYALHRLIDTHDRVIGDGYASRERGDFFNEHLIRNPLGNGSNLLVRRDAALAVGGFNPEYARAGIGGCEDLEFQLRLLRHHKIEVVREYLVGYRLRPGQMSADTSKMRLGQVAVIERIVREVPTRRMRDRALVEAYTVAAKGFLQMRDWRNAAKWVGASLAVSRMETARKFALQCGQELGYWWLRLMRRPRLVRAEQHRRFDDFDPREGVDKERPGNSYRSALRAGTRAQPPSSIAASPPQGT